MTGSLIDRVVMLTGAGGALGRASTLRFAAEGARVAAVDFVREAVDETVRLVHQDGGEAIPIVADVSDEDQVTAAVTATASRWDRIDVLFNNAGIMPHQDVSVLDMDLALWRQIYDTNVQGTALCCKHVIPHILAAGGGSVINMSSFLAFMGATIPQDGYSASKGALVGLTRSLAVEFGGRGIRVNAICPGPIETPHVRQFFPTEEARQRRLDRIPLGRFGRPEDVAELALFLASAASSWITGQAIILDGGISVNYL